MTNANGNRVIQLLALFGSVLGAIGTLFGTMPGRAFAEGQQIDARVPEISFNSEPYNYMVDTWQARQDLPMDTIRGIAETPDGYLWIGVSQGLIWFDGALFHFYTREEVPALGDENVECLLTARDGSLWIGTEGAGLVHLQGGIFRRVSSDGGPDTSFVRSLYQDSEGVIWVSTDGGLLRVEGDHAVRGNVELGIPVFNANAVIEDHLGRRWVGGYRLFVSDHGKAVEYVIPQKDVGSQIKSLLETRDGSIWVGTIEGIYRLSPGERHFSRIPGITGTISTLQEVADGELWAGSTIGGVYRIRGSTVTRLVAQDSDIGNVVLSIFRDSNQNLWIGTQTGITRLSRSPMHLVRPLGNQDLAIGTVSLDYDGSLWFVANQMVHIQGDKVTPSHIAGLSDVRARTLLRAQDRSLWIGTNGSGVYHVTSKGTKHYDVAHGLANDNVRALAEAKDGSLWIGTHDGLSHLDSHGLRNFKVADGLAYAAIHSVVADRDGDIWVGTDHGLSHLRNGSFASDPATRALSNEMVWSIYQDSTGGMWFGTQGGGLYSYSQGRVAHYTTSSGLVSNDIYSIMEDAKHRLWISTPSAVMLMDRTQLSQTSNDSTRTIPMRIFSENVGGRPVHFYGGMQPSGVLTPKGDGCFPASNGLWIIHPDTDIEPYRVHINIDSLFVDGRDTPVADSVELPAGSNRIEIVYGLEMLGSQQEWRFQYKLDGFDRNWIQGLPNRRGITYTNIPPGHYRFEVESWDLYHPERKVRFSFLLSKKPFFYQTLWFRFAVALATVGLVVLVFYMRVANINSRFRSIISERTRIAREMHDTLLQGCAGVSALLHAAAGDDLGDSSSRLHLIQNASTQIRATMDEARQAIWSLRAEVPTSLSLAQSIKLMTERIWRAYGMEAVLSVSGEAPKMSEATMRALTMIVREAVFNAILHANAQSIRVELTFSPGEVAIGIFDDGQGFTVNASPKDDDYGIMGMRERTDSLGGKLTIDSTLGKGTAVRVRVPSDRVEAAGQETATSKG